MGPDQHLSSKTNSVLEALVREDRFISAGELHLGMRSTGQTISLITVHRALHTLRLMRLVDTVVDEDGSHRYRHCSPTPPPAPRLLGVPVDGGDPGTGVVKVTYA
ncbi:hypothetical protein ALI22I_07835 [Saccharothrix sp. ALI-22-I]|uniref:transcriptional repressor n=1 Tax=Saccharothrix sp. ALI-22-I TaxID=1933778 RepID=UPI00097C8BDB|nr:transcriptional repressor [Saccharothrix sp. ALI-22-I]ONI91537.1 hypothetical protein ALI22I_07835 [Saccharothrix sp. ALI-22-I]